MTNEERLVKIREKLSEMGLTIDPTMSVDEFCNFFDKLDALLDQYLDALNRSSLEK